MYRPIKGTICKNYGILTINSSSPAIKAGKGQERYFVKETAATYCMPFYSLWILCISVNITCANGCT